MFDSHIVLTEQLNIQNICAQAKQAGLSGLCFTEHISSSFTHSIKIEYKSTDNLEICHGGQIDFEYDLHENMALKTAGFNFDYIVNNVSTVSGIKISDSSLYTNYIRNDVYNAYLEKIFDSLDASYDYSVIASPGYVSLNKYYPFPILTYKDFPETFDSILMHLVYSGKGIEINSSGFSKIKHSLPDETVLKRFFELGGEIVTVGSHSDGEHSMAGKDIKTAYDMLKSIGYKYVAKFIQGTAKMIEI